MSVARSGFEPPLRSRGPFHAVQFYESDAFLARTVARYLSEGLVAGDSGVVIATAAHRGDFSDALEAVGLDVERLVAEGRLLLLDARATSSMFMVDGRPEPVAFEHAIGAVIEQARATSKSGFVRAYGEIVDLLWRDGACDAALALERLWNELGEKSAFGLLCAYPIANFHDSAQREGFLHVCESHSHVEPSEGLARRETVAEQLRHVAMLEQRACALESELARRAELEAELRSACRAREEFLAIIGHELRNPLSPIMIAVHLLKARAKAPVREHDVIERQARHMSRLVDDLLDVSRITRGNVELRRVNVEIAEVLAGALDAVTPLIEERHHRLELALPQRGLRVNGDPARLAQILSNLLTNAAKYTPPGGAIRVGGRAEGDEVVLSVRDTGVGIEPAMLSRVFDPFVQETQSLDRSRGGLGLGLAIVKSLVELHGGSVRVLSEGRDRGCEIVVRLPLTTDATSEAASPPVTTSRPAAARSVLVVDDNEDSAELLAVSLETLGYVVRKAHDGPTALAAFDESPADVVLLDIGLPGMSGYELASALRARPRGDRAHVVALTGYGRDVDRKQALDAGCDQHVVKPIDLDALVSWLANVPEATSEP